MSGIIIAPFLSISCYQTPSKSYQALTLTIKGNKYNNIMPLQ